MRLARLDLVRYGRFTGKSLDFGAMDDGPDLHVVYGPNEAGKSTAFSAYLDLLYGIELRSRYAFLHAYDAMRIDATLEFGSDRRRFTRIKKAQTSLFDGDERPIAEAAILEHLGGIDREAYRAMFSLDDETIEAGGEGILASQGDLGQLLFAASRGLGDLGRRLEALREKAGDFHKLHGRKTILAGLKNDLDVLENERKAIDVQASRYAVLVRARAEADRRLDEARSEQVALRLRMEELARIGRALPKRDALRRLEAEFADLADLPQAPPGAAAEAARLRPSMAANAARIDDARAERARLDQALLALDDDPEALEQTDRLAALEPLQSRFRSAELDLPRRRTALPDLERVVDDLVRRLPGPIDPAAPPILPATLAAALRDLIERHSGVAERQAAARARLAAEADRLAETEAKLEAMAGAGGFDPERVRQLDAARKAFANSDHRAHQRLHARRLSAAADALADALQELAPWAGDDEALAALAMPVPAQVEAAGSAVERSVRDLEAARDAAKRAGKALAEAETAARLIAEASGLAGEDRAAALRAAREVAWSRHRAELSGESAEAFEAAMREDDLAIAGRIAGLVDRARVDQAKAMVAAKREEAECAGTACADAEAALAIREKAVADLIAGISPRLDPAMGARGLLAWIDLRKAALGRRSEMRAIRRDLDEAEADAGALRQRLTDAIAAIDPVSAQGADDGALLAAAEGLIERQANGARLLAERQMRFADHARAAEAGKVADAAHAAWVDAWRKSTSDLWFAVADEMPTIAVVRAVLDIDSQLPKAVGDRQECAERIAKMERDQDDYRDAIVEIASALGMPHEGRGTGALAEAVAGRITQALDTARRRKELEERLKDHARQAGLLEAERTMLHEQAASLVAAIGVDSLDAVDERLDRLRDRARLAEAIKQTRADMLGLIEMADAADAEALLDSVDRAQLAAELETLKAAEPGVDQRVRELSAEAGRARDAVEAIGGDDRVAQIEERRRTLILDMQAGLRSHLARQAGIIAVEAALIRFRNRHRSAMLERASEAFRTVTDGAYVGLDTQPGKDGEVLIARDANDGSKKAADLSKGTRFQLYLALRVAGYGEICRSRAPVPFIADDIMETFDDDRAAQAFRLFAGMAAYGQVIYLTHHRHLCEIARAVVPGLRLHDLIAA